MSTANHTQYVTPKTKATPKPRQAEKLSLSQAGVTRTLTKENSKARKGWMRNQPCYCGSGIKFKKCHGAD